MLQALKFGVGTAVLLLLGSCPPRDAQSADRNDAQADFDLLTRQVESEAIGAEVFYVPPEILFRVGFTSARLKTHYYYRITISEAAFDSARTALIQAMKATSVKPTAQQADLRWGLSLRLKSGAVREIYMDGFGNLGEIDGRRVAFHGALHGWLRQFTACAR